MCVLAMDVQHASPKFLLRFIVNKKVIYEKIILIALFSALSAPSIADTGLSGEVLFGNTNQLIDEEGTNNIEGSDLSFGLRAIYQFNPNMAFELSYLNYGKADGSYQEDSSTISFAISSTAVQAGVRGFLPLTNQLSVNARLGISYLNTELQLEDSSEPNVVNKDEDSSNSLYYGIGAKYMISPISFVGAEYTVSKHDLETFDDLNIENKISGVSLVAGLNF